MTKRWLKLAAVPVALALVAGACGDDDDDASDSEETTAETEADGGDGDDAEGGDEGDAGGSGDVPAANPDAAGAKFTLFGASTGTEGDAMAGFIDVYNEAAGTEITWTGSDDFEAQLHIRIDGGDPPAVAATPQPASICTTAVGSAVALEDLGYDIAELETNHSKAWMDLGLCEDGMHYGVPGWPNYKSIVFDHEPSFEAAGYEIPATYEELVALSEQAVADGWTPWCFGYESGGATGWPGTDWIEDIYGRTVDQETYSAWTKGEVRFEDEGVQNAFGIFEEILFGDGFVLGGAENVPGVAFSDSSGPLFQDNAGPNGDGPGCLMLKQGSFIQNFFNQQPEYEEGEEEEIGVFDFPSVDGNTIALGGGDTFIIFDDDPAVAAVVQDWTSPEWQCVLASGHGVEGVERLPGHKDTSLDCYENENNRKFAAAVTEALGSNTFYFDGGDLMDPAVGQGSFWEGMVVHAQGTSVPDVVALIDSGWPS